MKQEYEKQDELKRSALRAVAVLMQVPGAGELLPNNVILQYKCRHTVGFSLITVCTVAKFSLTKELRVSYNKCGDSR